LLGREIGSLDPKIGSPHILTRLAIRETSIAHRHFRFGVRVPSIADHAPLARHMASPRSGQWFSAIGA
jgi:hypothetical protein